MMKIVLVCLPAFCLLVRTNFASKFVRKPGTGGHLVKTNSGKFSALLSNKKHDSVKVRSKTRKRNKKTEEAVNRRSDIVPPGNSYF